jgi:hypothetical protein
MATTAPRGIVATIVKSQQHYSPLASAPFDRQVDIFKLARMREKSSIRLWNDFATEAPELARLVVAEVDSQKRESAKVTKNIDRVLAKAEKPKKKPKASVIKGAKPVSRTSPEWAAHQRALAETRGLMSFLNSDNPADRETARKMLGH